MSVSGVAAGPGGEAPVGAPAVGPWYFATLILACPECEAWPGVSCFTEHGTERRKFHLGRYAKARELAGRPLANYPPPSPARP